jgi:hypothetical protein
VHDHGRKGVRRDGRCGSCRSIGLVRSGCGMSHRGCPPRFVHTWGKVCGWNVWAHMSLWSRPRSMREPRSMCRFGSDPQALSTDAQGTALSPSRLRITSRAGGQPVDGVSTPWGRPVEGRDSTVHKWMTACGSSLRRPPSTHRSPRFVHRPSIQERDHEQARRRLSTTSTRATTNPEEFRKMRNIRPLLTKRPNSHRTAIRLRTTSRPRRTRAPPRPSEDSRDRLADHVHVACPTRVLSCDTCTNRGQAWRVTSEVPGGA